MTETKSVYNDPAFDITSAPSWKSPPPHDAYAPNARHHQHQQGQQRRPSTPARGHPVNDIDREAQRLIAEALNGPSTAGRTPNATNYRSDTPTPAYGPTPPVQLPPPPVPSWAAGTAVAAVGVGLGSIGLGAAINLVLSGLSAMTIGGIVAGALFTAIPLAGTAVIVLACGRAAARVRAAGPASVTYAGPVVRNTEVTSTARGFLSRATTRVN
ncbi:hypothetical protein [Kitasatospora camelliae]|uniref:Uncharacterized protein n=1 Tax=Kitasatospora camelliae TaxID=3156397 RepID=A0AAU8K4C7_9ACTN